MTGQTEHLGEVVTTQSRGRVLDRGRWKPELLCFLALCGCARFHGVHCAKPGRDSLLLKQASQGCFEKHMK